MIYDTRCRCAIAIFSYSLLLYFGKGAIASSLPEKPPISPSMPSGQENFDRDRLMGQIAINFALAGEFEKAIATAQSIEESTLQINAWVSIAEAMLSLGEYNRALALAARSDFNAIEGWSYPDLIYQAIAVYEAREGRGQRAVATAQNINAVRYGGSIRKIVEILLEKQDYEAAIELLLSHPPADADFLTIAVLEQAAGNVSLRQLQPLQQRLTPSLQALALSRMALMLHEQGNPDAARSLATQGLAIFEGVAVQRDRDTTLKIIETLASFGQFEKAMSLLPRLVDSPEMFNRGWRTITIELAAMGRFDEAIAMSRNLPENAQDEVLAVIAIEIAQKGELSRIPPFLERFETINPLLLRELAVAVTLAGDDRLALAVAQIYRDNAQYPVTVGRLAIAKAERGDISDAIAMLPQVSDLYRPEVVTQILRLLLETEDYDTAIALARQGEAYRDSLGEGYLDRVVFKLAERGYRDRALQLAAQLPESLRARKVYEVIATYFASQGDREGLWAVINSWDATENRDPAWMLITQELAAGGDLALALQLNQRIESLATRANNLGAIAIQLAEFEADSTQIEMILDRGLQWARQIDDSRDRGETFIKLSDYYLVIGDTEKAVQLLQEALLLVQ